MPEFYREILLNLSKSLYYDPSVPSTILSQYLWFNKHIYIGKKYISFSHFSNHGINSIGNFVDINEKYKSWDTINTPRKAIFPRSWNIVETSKRPRKYYLYINFLPNKKTVFSITEKLKTRTFQ